MYKGSDDLLAQPVLAILGPTGAGKSRFAVEVALAFRGEVISCDSMAVYRGVDIGTDKPSLSERRGVRHHLIDVVEPGAFFSAGAFRAKALEAIREIRGREALPIIVGGTGLYARALLDGMAPAPPRNEALRERLKAIAERSGAGKLHRILQRLDPASASRLHQGDALRVIRAIEVRLVTGRPMSRLIEERPFGRESLSRVLRLCLTAPRQVLYNRIERRAEAMVQLGLVEEVKALVEAGKLKGPVAKAIGYSEIARYLKGEIGLEQALALIKQRSRNLAKRQLTWFRRESGLIWLDIETEAWKSNAMERIRRWREAPGGQPGN
jgi:tRNA dimethylallyltransferase